MPTYIADNKGNVWGDRYVAVCPDGQLVNQDALALVPYQVIDRISPFNFNSRITSLLFLGNPKN